MHGIASDHQDRPYDFDVSIVRIGDDGLLPHE
jgi:hypothetical protein